MVAAKEAADKLRSDRRENTLPQAGRKPGFDAFSAKYLELASTQQKRKATRGKESDALARWRVHLANVRVDRVPTPMIKAFATMRLRGCRIAGKKYAAASPRTVSLDLISLRSVLKAGVEVGQMRELPRFPKIKMSEPSRRQLLAPEEFQRLLDCCLSVKPTGGPLTKNGEQVRDFLRLLAFSGARK